MRWCHRHPPRHLPPPLPTNAPSPSTAPASTESPSPSARPYQLPVRQFKRTKFLLEYILYASYHRLHHSSLAVALARWHTAVRCLPPFRLALTSGGQSPRRGRSSSPSGSSSRGLSPLPPQVGPLPARLQPPARRPASRSSSRSPSPTPSAGGQSPPCSSSSSPTSSAGGQSLPPHALPSPPALPPGGQSPPSAPSLPPASAAPAPPLRFRPKNQRRGPGATAARRLRRQNDPAIRQRALAHAAALAAPAAPIASPESYSPPLSDASSDAWAVDDGRASSCHSPPPYPPPSSSSPPIFLWSSDDSDDPLDYAPHRSQHSCLPSTPPPSALLAVAAAAPSPASLSPSAALPAPASMAPAAAAKVATPSSDVISPTAVLPASPVLGVDDDAEPPTPFTDARPPPAAFGSEQSSAADASWPQPPTPNASLPLSSPPLPRTAPPSSRYLTPFPAFEYSRLGLTTAPRAPRRGSFPALC